MGKTGREKFKMNHKGMKAKERIFFVLLLLTVFFPARVSAAWAMSVSGEAASFDGPLEFTQPEKGSWERNEGNWYFRTVEGILKNRWACIESPDGQREWYCFNASGALCTGWQKSGKGYWYYLRETDDSRMGAMERGFLLEPGDGHTYYLDPETGIMRTGWVRIKGKDYYFSTGGESASWYWDAAAGKWSFNGGCAHPTGSMYVNEQTPDGYTVDETGARK